MSFGGLGRLVYRFRWGFIALWVVVLVGSLFVAPRVDERLGGAEIEVPGSQSRAVQEALDEDFAGSAGSAASSFVVIFQGDGVSAESEEFRAAEGEVLDRLDEMPEVSEVVDYGSTGSEGFISEDGTASYASVGLAVSEEEAEALVSEVRDRAESGELATYVTGAPAVNADLQEASFEGIQRAEIFAVPIALLILVLAFGGLVAASIPVIIGLFSVVATLAVVYFAAGLYEMSIFVTSVATMLGLGLGIDYTLLAVSRFREELSNHSTGEAVERMVGTAGRTIFYAGLTVWIGMIGLLFFPFSILRSVGIGGLLVVFMTVAAALTLAPAILGVLGERINLLSLRRSRGDGSLWRMPGNLAMRWPVATILATTVLLAVMIFPLAGMQVNNAQAQALPEERESRAGEEILREDFDYASLNPIQVLAETPGAATSAESLRQIQELDEEIAATDGVREVDSLYTLGEAAAASYAEEISSAAEEAEAQAGEQVSAAVEQQLGELEEEFEEVPPGAEEEARAQAEEGVQQELQRQLPEMPEGIESDGTVTPEGVANFLASDAATQSAELQQGLENYASGNLALSRAVPNDPPDSPEARRTADSLRSQEPPEGTTVNVGGNSAQQSDIITAFYGPTTLWAGAFVLGASYLALAVTFRSAIMPLKGLLVNTLSLAASLGLMVFIFQQGNLSGLLSFSELGFIDAVVPILVFCVVFGISMDYEIFLLSRVKEGRDAGEEPLESVSDALGATGRIIASAAAILATVTGAFAFTGILQMQALGLGIAFAVVIAAFLMQMLFVPAVMRLLGEWAWWPDGRSGKKR